MNKPPSKFKSGLRIGQLGMALGCLALLCEALAIRPFLLSEALDSPGALTVFARLFLGNFSLLVATPLLVAASAIAFEASPWRLAIVSQSFILLVRIAIMGVTQGLEWGDETPFVWGFSLVAAASGVVFSWIGHERVSNWMKAREAHKAQPAATASSAPESPGGTSPTAPPAPTSEPTPK
jgi:hypothetical protein